MVSIGNGEQRDEPSLRKLQPQNTNLGTSLVPRNSLTLDGGQANPGGIFSRGTWNGGDFGGTLLKTSSFPRGDSDAVSRTNAIRQEQLEVACRRRGPCGDVGIARIGGVVEIQVDSRDGGVMCVDGCSGPLWREGRSRNV